MQRSGFVLALPAAGYGGRFEVPHGYAVLRHGKVLHLGNIERNPNTGEPLCV